MFRTVPNVQRLVYISVLKSLRLVKGFLSDQECELCLRTAPISPPILIFK